MRPILSGIWILLLGLPAGALELRAPVSFETTRVHRSHEWSIDLEGTSALITQRWSDSGLAVPYGSPTKTDTLDAQLLSTTLVTRVTYGLENHSEVFLEAPFYHLEMTVKQGADSREAAAFSSYALNEGYKPLQSESYSGLGDLRLGYRHLVFSDGTNSVALRGTLTSPTGRAPESDRLLALSTGQGLWIAGAQMVWGYRILPRLRWNFNGGMDIPFSDEVDVRVPKTSGDPISSDSERVSRRTGNILSAGTSLQIGSVSKGLSGGLGYHFQYSDPTRFQGSRYDSQRYQWLEELNPSKQLQSSTGELRYIWGDLDNLASGPIELALAYTKVLAGANVEDQDLLTAKVGLLF